MDASALKLRAERLFKSFAPGQLAIIGLLTVGIAIGAMTFMHWASAPSYSVLFSGLDSKDASDVVSKLKSQGVNYKLTGDGGTLMVPASKVYDLRLAMSAAGLPKGGVVGYEILDKQGLTASEFSQQVGYQRALEGELTRTLMAMHGMESVTVHLGIPQDQLFSDNTQQPRASVLVKTAAPMDYDTVDSIVHLVASSVPGLQPEAVTVADTNGHVLSSDGTSSTGGSTREIQTTQQYESDLAANASAMLAQVYGPGHAVVRVSARLNFDQTDRQTDTYDPKTTTPLRSQSSSETYKAGDPSATGTTAAGALGTTATTTATGTGSNSTNYQKSDGTTEFGVNHITETSKVAPGKVERLSVAVVLDGGAKPAPDADKVKQVVGAALGLDATRGDNIVVDTMRFDGAKAAASGGSKSSGAAAAGGAGGMGKMIDYARTGLGAVLVLAVLLVLLRRLRRTKVELIDLPALGTGSVATALARAGGTGTAVGAGGAPVGAISVPVGDGSHGGELVPVGVGAAPSDDVLRMVDQQPDEVAVLLRSWLGDRRA